jgi:GT2 family glycosyltransferase
MPIEPLTSFEILAGSLPPVKNYDVDIIILTLDRYNETMAAIASAQRQVGVSFHISILDQGSKPPTRQLIAEAAHKTDNIGFFGSSENIGVPGGRNFLSCLGHGQIIVALDNDAIFEDDLTVLRAKSVFDATPELGALGFRILNAETKQLDVESWGYPKSLIPRFQDRFTSTTFVGAGHAVRRAAWIEAECYDKNLFFTWEEFDFSLRLIARKWLVKYDGTIGILHKGSAEARVTWSDKRTFFYVRNRLMIARKWERTWFKLMPRMLAYLIRGALSGHLKPTIQGVLAAVSMSNQHKAKAMPPEMRYYLSVNDKIHRGSLLKRVWVEVLGR